MHPGRQSQIYVHLQGRQKHPREIFRLTMLTTIAETAVHAGAVANVEERKRKWISD
jgi:hypothetical protein